MGIVQFSDQEPNFQLSTLNSKLPMPLAKAKPALVVVAVFVLVAISIILWQQMRLGDLARQNRRLEIALASSPQVPVPDASRTHEPTSDPHELARLHAAEESLKLEVSRLRGRLAAVLRDEPRPAAPSVPSPAASKTGTSGESGTGQGLLGGINDMMQGMVEQQFEGRLARMKASLNLSPEQEQAIRSILKRQATQATRAAQKMLAGGMSAEDSAELQREVGDPESQIKALLTPEQTAAYKDYQKSENRANARLAANGELLQMQNLLGLNQEQQDQVFAVLYDQTYSLLDNPAAAAALPDAANPGATLDRILERKLKALEGVLTADQMTAYRRLQDQQNALIKKMMPTITPKTGVK
jgi:hypothetical protein